ncbi:MAG TPA: serine/threonine-protein kinase, partial [Polyangiaceae bacterium]
IKSEHIARVSDVGTLETGEPYMVMEYLEGEDLGQWLTRRGALPVEQAVEFVIQACEALADAHSLGIVHRDLKPANLFSLRRSDGLLAIKVLDFGISKASLGAAGSDLDVTKTATVMGSPLYMSPEQLESARNVDARGDIWALGAVLYELVSGQPPFMADSLPGLILQITQKQPASLRGLRPDIPAALELVIARCLEKDRAKRYPNVAELAQALVEFGPKRARPSVERAMRVIQAAGLSVSALALPPSSDRRSDAAGAPVAASSNVGTQSSFGQTDPPKRESSRGVLYALVAVLVLGGVGALVFWQRASAKSASAELAPASSVTAVATTPLSVAPALPAAALPVITPEPFAPAAGEPPAPASATPVAPTAAPNNPKSPTKRPVSGKPAPEPAAKSAAPAAKPAPAPKSNAPAKNSLNGLIEDRQ